MSAVMQTPPVSAQAAPAPATVAGPVTQVRVVRSEWAKLRALRSTWWCGLLAVVLIVGVGAAITGSGTPYKISAGNSAAGGVAVSLAGVVIAQLVLGVLGVLLFSGEYATGMIRATLAVIPARLPVLWAKLMVVVGFVLPLSLLAAVAEFFTATALEAARGGSALSLTDPGVLLEVAGAALYLAVIAVIGLALGALLRRTAAGLAVFAGVFFVVPIVTNYLPHSITGFAPYLLSSAGGTCGAPGSYSAGIS
jgi:ABC-2 type transport system permease protein